MSANLNFDDEFNSLDLYSSVTGKGTWDTTYWWADGANSKGNTLTGNNEQEWYINADYARTASVKPWTVNNGVLNIQAAPASADISAQINGYKYTSGMLDTYHSFTQTYGYFEMRADLPAGKGLWPAFWLLPADGSWPPELDVMEVLGDNTSKLYTTVHSTTLPGGMQSVNGGTTVADMSSGYHTYAVDWEPDHITWYFDNKQIYQVATPADMNKPMYMLVNLAVGGSWPGSPDASTQFPANMQVDYVKAWSANPYADGTAGAAGSTTATSGASSPPPPSDAGTGTGAGAPVSPAGLTLTSTRVGSVLIGGAGADTLIASQANDTLTGGAGQDLFVFKSEPWSPIHITDFQVGTDKLDLSALFKAAGYTGADPVADGWIYIASDGAGGATVRFDHDGHGSSPVWPNTIIDLEKVSPTGLTWGQLTGQASASSSIPATPPPATTPPTTAPPPAPTDTAGLTLTASKAGSVLIGGAGADTLIASQANDTLTGGAGADSFTFKSEPWSPIHITDFQVGVDKLDLSALFKAAGYAGTNPVGDGWIYLASDGAGGTTVRFDHDGHGSSPVWPNTIIDLHGVAPGSVTWEQLSGATASAAAGASTPVSTLPSGLTLSTDQPNTSLAGGAGADTLTAGPGYTTLTGGAGADHFVLKTEPWAPIKITDFQPGADKLDLSALFQTAGYGGSDPVADGYVYVQSDGAGGSVIRFDHDGHGDHPVWPNTIVDLVGIAPTQVKTSDWILH